MVSRVFNKLRAKLAGIDGETLVETLVSTLIMALVMLMLCTAIVSAAKINAIAKASEASFNQEATGAPFPEEERVKSLTMTVTVNTWDSVNTEYSKTLDSGAGINAYTQNGYVYYETDSSN